MTPAATPVRIVVADDHPIVRGGIVALLERASGFTVVGEASTGLEAVSLVAAVQPDVVLMDLRMPGIGGADATARIRAEHPAVHVLVLTTYESDADILGAIEAGASGYLLKAAPEEEIVAGIRSVARGEVALAPGIAALLVARVAAGEQLTADATSSAGSITLTPRETEVLRLVARGHSNPQIGRALYVSESTVKTHLLRAFEKLDVNDRTRAVTRAMELGLI